MPSAAIGTYRPRAAAPAGPAIAPPQEFNFAPYNALQVVVRPGNLIGVEVFFWPGALNPEQSYKVSVSFDNAAALSLDARTTMDYRARGGAAELPRSVAGSGGCRGAARLPSPFAGTPAVELLFSLDDSTWLLRALQDCVRVLPQP